MERPPAVGAAAALGTRAGPGPGPGGGVGVCAAGHSAAAAGKADPDAAVDCGAEVPHRDAGEFARGLRDEREKHGAGAPKQRRGTATVAATGTATTAAAGTDAGTAEQAAHPGGHPRHELRQREVRGVEHEREPLHLACVTTATGSTAAAGARATAMPGASRGVAREPPQHHCQRQKRPRHELRGQVHVRPAADATAARGAAQPGQRCHGPGDNRRKALQGARHAPVQDMHTPVFLVDCEAMGFKLFFSVF
jgi:hypothetical protein